uniref:ANIS5_cation-bd domain-containing protein n=1 Tax=Panagrellus redivivus TaxID=6233 RepID=A0A7E4VQV1_PANRE
MGVKSSLFVVLLFGVVAVFGKDPLPQPTFLQGLNSSAVGAFKDIEDNSQLSLNDMNSQLRQWASQQSPDIQNALTAWQQNVTATIQNMVSQADAKVGSMSSDAQTLYNQTKAIALNNNLPVDQICSQLTTLFKQAHDSTIFKLYRAFPQIVKLGLNMCKNHRGSRRKRQMYQNYRYDSPEFHSPEYNSRESWERYNGRNGQGYQNGNLRNQGQYYYGNGNGNQGYGYGK